MKDEMQFDQFGRMKYHPDFHPNYKKPFSESDLEYLCKYWDVDDRRSISFALGRPEHSLANKVYELKRDGLFDYYKNLNKHW